MLIRFYIDKKDLRKLFPDRTDHGIDAKWKECKDYCEEKGIPLWDASTIPISAFCKVNKLNIDEFRQNVNFINQQAKKER